jgi:putative protease
MKTKENTRATVKKKNIKPQLLAPAGNMSSLLSAIGAGADAVYFGIKNLNMRHEASNFDILEIKKVMKLLHENNLKGYLALNVLVYDEELLKVKKIITESKKAKVDGIICWDMAVINLAKEAGLDINISTQASISNFEAVKFYNLLGAKKIILARECSLKTIKEIIKKIKKHKLNCEIETFIHGAMCVSISGRCFLSESAFGKSANRGKCLQPCRREYLIIDKDKEAEYIVGEDYILSAKDLCSIDFIEKLIEAGIKSFKIEGRMRQPEYVKEVTAVYREAIDSYFNKKLNLKLKKSLKNRLEGVYHRSYSKGFYFKKPSSGRGLVERAYDKIYLGEVRKYFNKIKVAEVIIRAGTLKTGDKILVSGPKTPATFLEISTIEINHKRVKEAQRGQIVGLKVASRLRPEDKVFIWKKKHN